MGDPPPGAPHCPTPITTLGVARRAEHLGVEADAGRLEEDLSADLRGIGPRHATARDDLRSLDGPERETETVRDIHHASERQDPEDDRAVQQPRGCEGDRPISAGDDARLVALFDRTSREIGRGRRLRAGLTRSRTKPAFSRMSSHCSRSPGFALRLPAAGLVMSMARSRERASVMVMYGDAGSCARWHADLASR